MRYAGTHKDETHQKVLKIAAAQLREKGPDRIAVAEVMKAAGLTHGGFYAHFKSKDAFLVETLETAFGQAKRRWARRLEGLPPRHALATFIDYHLSASHRDNPANGCAITALTSDLPRQAPKFRAAFETGVKSLAGSLAGWMANAGVPDAERLAPSILSAMAGAVALSRTISDAELSEELLFSARTGIKARLGLTDLNLASETLQ
jgi:TetR/AcrR family transcriptional regulator, transcriptional repressor for nem operon